MDRLILQFGQSKLILSLIIIVGGVLGYMSYSGQDEIPLPESPITGKDSIATFADFQLDLSILDNPKYKSLEIFGENPVNPGITGEKRNLFAPIQ